nr:hypothetical protein [bacterium]
MKKRFSTWSIGYKIALFAVAFVLLAGGVLAGANAMSRKNRLFAHRIVIKYGSKYDGVIANPQAPATRTVTMNGQPQTLYYVQTQNDHARLPGKRWDAYGTYDVYADIPPEEMNNGGVYYMYWYLYRSDILLRIDAQNLQTAKPLGPTVTRDQAEQQVRSYLEAFSVDMTGYIPHEFSRMQRDIDLVHGYHYFQYEKNMDGVMLADDMRIRVRKDGALESLYALNHKRYDEELGRTIDMDSILSRLDDAVAEFTAVFPVFRPNGRRTSKVCFDDKGKLSVLFDVGMQREVEPGVWQDTRNKGFYIHLDDNSYSWVD